MDAIRVTQVPATLVRLGHKLVGTLHLMRHHMIFRAAQREVWICYPIISEVAKRPGRPAVRIVCKDFMFLSFEFAAEDDARAVYETLDELCHSVRNVEQLYAFVYSPASVEREFNGWDLYDPRAEYNRMGIDWTRWRITRANAQFGLCATYPRLLVVPATISDSVLGHAARYRSKARLPVLSYHHPLNRCTISRCSQPLVGIKQSRNLQDETLITSIYATTYPPEGMHGAQFDNMVVDLRPATNAIAQMALGGGTENMDRYRPARKIYSGIDNLHVMRDSLSRVVDALRHSDVSESAPSPTALERSQWLRHIQLLLDTTRVVVQQVHFKCSHVVIHCSDGWDRTPQISSLAMLCLDPYYRTLEGFMVLVEKEWVSFGHRFALRHGGASASENDALDQSEVDPSSVTSAATGVFANVSQFISETTKGRQTGPIFHQFLDAAYQLVHMFPSSFEFNERFLRRLVYHTYSCQYGTFLFNSEKEALAANVRSRTRSVWDYFLARRTQFVSQGYEPVQPGSDEVLVPSPDQPPRWWAGAFGRADADMNDPEAWRKNAPKMTTSVSQLPSAPSFSAPTSSSASSSSQETTEPPEQSVTLSTSVTNALKMATLGEPDESQANSDPKPQGQSPRKDSPREGVTLSAGA